MQYNCPAEFWPRGQNKRRHNRTPRVDIVRKKYCSVYQKKSRFRVIQPAKNSCAWVFSRLGVICVVGVPPGFSLAIDRPKWFPLSLSIDLRKKYAKNASQAISRLAVEWCQDSLYIDFSQFAGHSYFNAKGDSSRSK